jgi:hypothetical protein
VGILSEYSKRVIKITVVIIIITILGLLFIENQKYKTSISRLISDDLSLFAVRINSNIFLLEELINGSIISRDQLIIEQEKQYQMINTIQRDTLLLKNFKKVNSKDFWATEDRLTRFSSFLNKLILTEQSTITLSQEQILEGQLEYAIQKKWSIVLVNYRNENDSLNELEIEDAVNILNELESISGNNIGNN